MEFQVRFLTLLLPLLMLSCDKEDDMDPAPAKTREEMLTSHGWKPEEARAQVTNTTYYYKRGVTVPTDFNLNNESITFNTNNTGTYTGTNGTTYNFSWMFTNVEKTKLSLVVPFESPSTTIYWENIILTDTELKYDEHYTRNGMNFMGWVDRMPK